MLTLELLAAPTLAMAAATVGMVVPTLKIPVTLRAAAVRAVILVAAVQVDITLVLDT